MSNAALDRAAQQVEACMRQLKYNYAANVRRDAVVLCSNLPSLLPQVGILTYDNGRQSTLMFLTGTIPIYYKGGRYNIPINIWVVEMYPYHPPLCYVVPTQNMIVKPKHKHVDSSGRCYLPYLAEWNAQKSSLYELVNHLSAIFGADPPVYQKASPSPNLSTTGASSTNSSTYGGNANTASQNSNSQNSANNKLNLQKSKEMRRKQTVEQITHKVHKLMEPLCKETAQRIDNEFETQNKLRSREKVLQGHESQLKQVEEALKKRMTELESNNKQVTEYIEENSGKLVDIDVVVSPQDAHSEQILDNTAEENTFDDVMYYLGEALHQKLIDLDTYLKHIRQLSKDQFMRKALLKKIHTLQKTM